jgi:hypothetical protein
MTELFIFIMGVLAGNILIMVLAKMKYNRLVAAEKQKPETSTNVLIEKHEQSFLAYGENYEFLGQSTELEGLLLKILKNSEKAKIFVSDPKLAEEITEICASLKSDHSQHETSQPQQ